MLNQIKIFYFFLSMNFNFFTNFFYKNSILHEIYKYGNVF